MSKLNYAWDSSIFLAWLCEDPAVPLADISQVVEEIDEGKANLIVAVVAYTEILEAKNTPDQMARFNAFLKRSNVVNAQGSIIVAQKAGDIRSKGLASQRKIKTPDATHIATAILYGADILHTLDAGMLALSGNAIVDGLKIAKPASLSGQRSFLGQFDSSSDPPSK